MGKFSPTTAKKAGESLYRVGDEVFSFIDDAIDAAKARWAAGDEAAKVDYLDLRRQRDAVKSEAGGNTVERMARADEQGYGPAVYHGTKRMDRLLDNGSLNSKRATSGPMPFFTDDAQIASNYASSKADTSLYDVDNDFGNWFKFKAGPGREKNLDSVWWHLKDDERAAITEKLGKITLDDDNLLVIGDGPGGKDHWEWALKEAHGNPLVAAKDVWLNSGMIYGEEERFIQVLRKAGLKSKVKWDAPHMEMQGVFPARLRMNNPLDTSNDEALSGVLEHLEKAGKGKRYKRNKDGADQWDKKTIGIKEFTDRLREDIADGTYHAWTSIPDDVTAELKALGYDGIIDQGGKGGGMGHGVHIPFDENQVRSINADFDPAKKHSADLLAGIGGAAVLAGATASEQAEATPGMLGATAALSFYEDDPDIDEIINKRITAQELRAATGRFLQKQQSRKTHWDGLRQDLMATMQTLGEGANFALEAIEIPMKGIHGLTAVAGDLAAGNSLQDALSRGGSVARQPLEQTAQQQGDAVFNATGSPALGATAYTGTLFADVW